MIAEFHSSPIGGHSGYLRTYKRLASIVYWEGLKRDVQEFVSKCDVCQRNKYQAMSPAGLLQPLPVPQHVWEDVTMDFIVRLPKSKGYDTVMVVVDRFTKYAHFIPLKHPFTAKDVAAAFVQGVVRLHGFPKSIVSDRDRVFVSLFWKELFKMAGTTLKYSSGYHPETDGQSEVVNRTLETYLRCFTGHTPKQWGKWIAWAEYRFNTTYNQSSGMSPFKALYGRDPPTLFKWEDCESAVEDVNEYIRARNIILGDLKENLTKAQERMKHYADKHRREVQYEVGDLVYLKISPYKLRSLAKKVNEKLSPRFYGPYKIKAKYGEAAYLLELPETTRIHPVFHVSQLKKALSPTVPTQDLPAALTEDLELQVEPEEVKKVRKVEEDQLQVLIKWRNLPEFENTWEDYVNS